MTTRPLCFDGMCWTINSIIMLYNEQKEIGYTYILTGRLNSDVKKTHSPSLNKEEDIFKFQLLGYFEQLLVSVPICV